MAYIGTPVVRHHCLQLPNDTAHIELDGCPLGAAWFLWLQTATRFSYALGRPTYYNLTFRHEKRRHGLYWYAYLKVDSKLHNAYAGRSPDLTVLRMVQLAQKLLDTVKAKGEP